MKNNLTVIIPVHKCNEDVNNLLLEAVRSVGEMSILISTTPDLVSDLFNMMYDNGFGDQVTVISDSTSETISNDFCSLVNYGVSQVNTEWFSILEFDDVYRSNWWDNIEKYIEYMPSCSVFLPLTELKDFRNMSFIGYGNEAPWATSFSNEVGYIDNDCLQEYFDFYLTGGVYNTKDWRNVGGLKSSIKLTFWYEFLLRLTNQNKKVYVIPKLGYTHYLNRPNSIYEVYNNTIDEKEGNWWYELARQEYFFKEDRNKTYTPNTTDDDNNGDNF